MRQHADHLIGRVGLQQQAGIDEDALPARHEGVDLTVVQHIDGHRLGIDPRRLEDRPGVEAQQALDLGIADEGRRLLPRLLGIGLGKRHAHEGYERRQQARRGAI